MKTKFYSTPKGPPGKQARTSLRAYGRTYLLALLHRLQRATDYRKLNLKVSYTPPFGLERASFDVMVNRKEYLHFYLSPGEGTKYIADRVTFVHWSANAQGVSFEVTKEQCIQDLFIWYEREGIVEREVNKDAN